MTLFKVRNASNRVALAVSKSEPTRPVTKWMFGYTLWGGKGGGWWKVPTPYMTNRGLLTYSECNFFLFKMHAIRHLCTLLNCHRNGWLNQTQNVLGKLHVFEKQAFFLHDADDPNSFPAHPQSQNCCFCLFKFLSTTSTRHPVAYAAPIH